jgi:hypothetical protein
MSSWRTVCVAALGIVAVAAVGAELTSPTVVVPPMIAALVVLLAAALAVDYFGFARRQLGWDGFVASTQARRTMVTALERRFVRERKAGAVRTGATARTLLVALAEDDDLRRAADVCDFLAADAATRVHKDVVADALRVLALAELGRLAEARRVDDTLGARVSALPVVAFARGRTAECAGKLPAALAHVDRGLRGDDRRGARRDLGVMRARLLVRLGRGEDARVELDRVARGGGRRTVEALVVVEDAGVALAARQALGLAAIYR